MARLAKAYDLWRGEERLGRVIVAAELCDFPWYGGWFAAAPAFAPFAASFAEELRLLDAESMDEWGALWRHIEGPGLRLVPDDGGAALHDPLFHIDGDTLRWRE